MGRLRDVFYHLRQRLLAPVLEEQAAHHKDLRERLRLIEEIQRGLALRSVGFGIEDPVYTNVWFDHNIPILTRLMEGAAHKPCLRMLEIGCYEGRSTRWFMENILTDLSSTMVCVDTFEGSAEHGGALGARYLRQMFNRNLAPYKDRMEVHVGSSRDVLPTLSELDGFDIVYVDGDHFGPTVYHDAREALRLCRAGGLVVFDDYDWKWFPRPEDNPGAAIDRFLAECAARYVLVHKGYQVAIRKRAD